MMSMRSAWWGVPILKPVGVSQPAGGRIRQAKPWRAFSTHHHECALAVRPSRLGVARSFLLHRTRRSASLQRPRHQLSLSVAVRIMNAMADHLFIDCAKYWQAFILFLHRHGSDSHRVALPCRQSAPYSTFWLCFLCLFAPSELSLFDPTCLRSEPVSQRGAFPCRRGLVICN